MITKSGIHLLILSLFVNPKKMKTKSTGANKWRTGHCTVLQNLMVKICPSGEKTLYKIIVIVR
jgi:hypothetical protein